MVRFCERGSEPSGSLKVVTSVDPLTENELYKQDSAPWIVALFELCSVPPDEICFDLDSPQLNTCFGHKVNCLLKLTVSIASARRLVVTRSILSIQRLFAQPNG
jgi:hypothetical protein